MTERITAREYREMTRKKRNKYNAKKKTVDGIKFASQAEARRYKELKLMQENGAIEDLKLQPRFEIIPKQEDEQRAVYTADFQYYDPETNTEVVEEVKGGKATKTTAYVLRRKLFKLNYPEYEHREVEM